jgi:hypothetical protein
VGFFYFRTKDNNMQDSPPLKITAQLLREAADLITPADMAIGFETTFMCTAVIEAFKRHHDLYLTVSMEVELTEMFEQILFAHEVDTSGCLAHPVVRTEVMSTEQRQALRFDFLNLLAESMDRPRWIR